MRAKPFVKEFFNVFEQILRNISYKRGVRTFYSPLCTPTGLETKFETSELYVKNHFLRYSKNVLKSNFLHIHGGKLVLVFNIYDAR